MRSPLVSRSLALLAGLFLFAGLPAAATQPQITADAPASETAQADEPGPASMLDAWFGDRRIEAGERVGNLHIGSTTLAELFGEDAPAARTTADGSDPSLAYDEAGAASVTFDAVGLLLEFDAAGELSVVHVSAADFTTRAGLGVGSRESELRETLGEPLEQGNGPLYAGVGSFGLDWPGLTFYFEAELEDPVALSVAVHPAPFDLGLLIVRILRSGLGLAFFCAVAWLLSSHKKRFPLRVVLSGLALQFALAGLILGTGPGRKVFEYLAGFFATLVATAAAGTELVFGVLAQPGTLAQAFPEELANGGVGFIFAFAATGLLVIIPFSAMMSVLYHMGVMQLLIFGMAKVMSKLLKVSGAESMAMAANVFVGQTEAPLVIKPYLEKLTRSELNALMTGGFATIAGSVLAVYMGFLGPEIGPHLLTASVMSAPAAFLIAKIIMPETEVATTGGKVELKLEKSASNLIEAAANGTTDGLKLYLNVVAMLIAFVGLVALVDWPLEALNTHILHLDGGFSLDRIFGWVFAPVAWFMGIDGWHDCKLFGSLLGIKIAVNEFVAMGDLTVMASGAGGAVAFESKRSAIMAAYALCGFANFGSIGIQLGGIAALAPGRKQDLAKLAVKAMLGGAFASWMTATVAGAFL